MRPTLRPVAFAASFLLSLWGCKKDNEVDRVQSPIAYATVSTLAGSGSPGFVNGVGTAAKFYSPDGGAVDTQGNLYVADYVNGCVRKITPAGLVSTFAGGTGTGLLNGPAATAKFSGILDVAIDVQGNLYVADTDNACIRKITAAGIVSTLAGTGTAGFADGPGTTAQFSSPSGVAVDAQGTVYVADYGNFRIRKILPNGTVSTLAGTGQRGYADGAGSVAQFKGLEGLALNTNGLLYAADTEDHRIRTVTSAGVVSTLAGTGVRGFADGAGAAAQFYIPAGVAVDSQGDVLVSEVGNNCIRRIDKNGVVSTLAGTRVAGMMDGPVGTAQFDRPSGLIMGATGVFYVTESSHRIRKVAAQ